MAGFYSIDSVLSISSKDHSEGRKTANSLNISGLPAPSLKLSVIIGYTFTLQAIKTILRSRGEESRKRFGPN